MTHYEYTEILNKNNILSKYIPQKCDGESLDSFFHNGEKFDFIYSRNALDHAYDPFKAISNMVNLLQASTKSCILLEMQHNEGKFQNYTGLHQWNFDLTEDGDVKISNKYNVEHNLSSLNVNNDLKILVGSYNYCVPRWNDIKTYLIIVIFKNYDSDEIINYNSFLNSYLLAKGSEFVKDIKKASPFLNIKPFIKRTINNTYYLLHKIMRG